MNKWNNILMCWTEIIRMNSVSLIQIMQMVIWSYFEFMNIYIYINGSQKWDTVIKPKRLWFHSKKKIENLTKSTKLLFVAKTKIYKRRKCNVKRNEEAHRELGKGGGMSNGGGRVRVGGKGISSEEGERLNSLESCCCCCCCVGIVIVSVELRARLLIWRVWIVRHWSVLEREREIEIERDKRKRVIDMLGVFGGKRWEWEWEWEFVFVFVFVWVF